MSEDPNGILAYGYDLGGPQIRHGWKLKGASEYGNYELPDWYQQYASSFIEQVEAILLDKLANFTEEYNLVDDVGYRNRRSAAQSKVGMEIVRYGSYAYSGYILVVSESLFETPEWGSCPVKPNVIHSASDRLDRALRAMQLDPTQLQPEWILASFYG
jgi:hypothetical protein